MRRRRCKIPPLGTTGEQHGMHDEQKTPWNEAQARAAIAEHAGVEGSLLIVLQALQTAFGFVPDEAVPLVAETLNLSRAEVHGVLSFYHDFKKGPEGRHVLKLCRAEACQSMGGEKLAEHVARAAGLAFGETAADDTLSLESVYCLGLCGCAPAALYDGKPVGRLTAAKLDGLLSTARA